jgi:ribosomal protein L12E/L44/L45/RPP1/RPP2
MSDSKMKDDFIVSSKLTDEQKTKLKIRLIKDPGERSRLEAKLRAGDEQVDRERARLDEERKQLVEKQVCEALQAKPGLAPAPPRGATQETQQQKAQRLEKQFDDHQKQKDEKQIEELRRDLHRDINKEPSLTKGQGDGKGHGL